MMLRHALRAVNCSGQIPSACTRAVCQLEQITLRLFHSPQPPQSSSKMPSQRADPGLTAAPRRVGQQCNSSSGAGPCLARTRAAATTVTAPSNVQGSTQGQGRFAAPQQHPQASKRKRTAARQMTLTGEPSLPQSVSAPAKQRGSGSGRGGSRSKVEAAAPRSLAADGAPGWTDLGEGATVWYSPAAWSATAASDLLRRLQEEVPWEQREVRVMGRTVMQPRLIAYMAGDPSLSYTYSGLRLTPAPWSPAVAEIKAKLEQMAGAKFDSCLLNLYRDGGDHMGWHSDNEPLYGCEPVIGSASFGAARDFMMRQNWQHNRKLRFPLGNGDALVMSGTTQDHWMHAIPKRAGVQQPRVNLTFRRVVHPERAAAG